MANTKNYNIAKNNAHLTNNSQFNDLDPFY